jgi:FkbM family methyltransferase
MIAQMCLAVLLGFDCFIGFRFYLFMRPCDPRDRCVFHSVKRHDPVPVNCSVPNSTPLTGDTLLHVVNHILQLHGGPSGVGAALDEVRDWATDFDTPNDTYSHATLDVVRRALELGIACRLCLAELPAELTRRLAEYADRGIREIQKITARVNPGILLRPEAFEDDHGLRSAPQSHRDYIKNRAILDIGAFVGDSAIALAKHARRVYSFELSPSAFRTMLRVLNQTSEYTPNVVPILGGVGEKENTVYVGPFGIFAVVTEPGRGTPVNITTIDDFVRRTGETIGFVKIDTEGGGLGMLRAAEKTLRTQKPIIALGCYHEYNELFGVPRFFKTEFPDYRFNWQMHTWHPSALSELTFYAYPSHLAKN